MKSPKYALKTNYLSRDKLNRYVKDLSDKITEDRNRTIKILEEAKTRMDDIPTNQAADGLNSSFLYSEALKGVTNLLKQVQETNISMIKILDLVSGHVKLDTKDDSFKTKEQKKKNSAGNAYERLLSLTKGDSDGIQEEDDESD